MSGKKRFISLGLAFCLALLLLTGCGGPEPEPNISEISPGSELPVSPTDDAPATPDEPFPIAAYIRRFAVGDVELGWRYDFSPEELAELWEACNSIEYLGEAPEPEYDQPNFRYSDPQQLYRVSFTFETENASRGSLEVFEGNVATRFDTREHDYSYFSPESLDFGLFDTLISNREIVIKSAEDIAAAEEYFRQLFAEDAPGCTLDYVTYDPDVDEYYTDVASHYSGGLPTGTAKEDFVTLCFSYSAEGDTRYDPMDPGKTVAVILIKQGAGWSRFNWTQEIPEL